MLGLAIMREIPDMNTGSTSLQAEDPTNGRTRQTGGGGRSKSKTGRGISQSGGIGKKSSLRGVQCFWGWGGGGLGGGGGLCCPTVFGGGGGGGGSKSRSTPTKKQKKKGTHSQLTRSGDPFAAVGGGRAGGVSVKYNFQQ